MLGLLLATLAHAADEPSVWDWSKPHRYRVTTDEIRTPPIEIAIADNIMTQLAEYAMVLELTCGASAESSGAGGTTVDCKVDDAKLSGGAGDPKEQAQLDESLRHLEIWMRGASVDFVQKSDGDIKRIGEVEPGPDAERMSRNRTLWLNAGLQGCLRSLSVVVSETADEWRTPISNGTMKLHVTERTDDRLTFEGQHGEIALMSVVFDRQLRVIERSHMHFAALGSNSMANQSLDITSELLDPR
jgi:hypothetical protein